MEPEARLRELAMRASRTEQAVYTRFLDPAMRQLALRVGAQLRLAVLDEGGVPDAERRIVAFAPLGMEPGELLWPIRCVRVRWNPRYGSPAHRDLLGAMLALGITRDQLGDMIVMAAESYCFITQDMAQYIMNNLSSVGRFSVTCTLPEELPALETATGLLRADTVASLRLDGLLASGFRLSRADAQALIREGRVRVDHIPETRVDRLLAEGSLVSIRGMGRVVLRTVEGLTRKGRIRVVFEAYGLN